MKCQDFETTIYSLAHGQLVEASMRSRTHAHIEQCANCADAFTQQRAVASRVRAVMASLANEGASAHVEEALILAVRRQAVQKNTPTIRPATTRQPRSRWVEAATAAVVFLVLLIGMKWLKPPTADQRQVVRHQSTAPAGPASSRKEELPDPNEVANGHDQKRAGRPNSLRTLDQNAARNTEVMTNFYPLADEDELIPLESGQVVRVEVSASALVTLGLPITAEDSNQPIQADLLLGQDGLARAIRFLP